MTNAHALVQEKIRGGDLEGAQAVCQQLVNANSADAEALNMLGILALKRGAPQEALENLRKAVSANPREANYHLNLSQALFSMGESKKALKKLKEAQKLNPSLPGLHTLLAQIYAQEKDMKRAMRHCQEALKANPFDTNAYLLAAEFYKKQNRSVDASTYFEKAGLVALQQGANLEKPEVQQMLQEVFGKAVECNPKNHQAQYNLGLIYLKKEEHDKALSCFDKALHEEPKNTTYLLRIAKVTHSLGMIHEPMYYFQKLLEINPEDSVALLFMGSHYDNQGKPGESLKCVNKAQELNPDNPLIYALKLQVLERLNRMDEAHAVLNEALEKFPDNRTIRCPQAVLEMREGRLEDAETHLREADFSFFEEFMVQKYLGDVLEKQKRYDDAYEAYSTSKELVAATPRFRRIRGELFHKFIHAGLKGFSAEKVEGWKEHRFQDDLKPPVFLMGFPRSGTTLTEQILATHPNIDVTNEEPIIDEVVRNELIQGHFTYPQDLSNLTEEQMLKLRRYYKERIEGLFAEEETPPACMVDKNPTNFIHLGMMLRLFPEAGLIMLIRDPRDVILSCFKQAFVPNISTVNFTTLEHTAKTYAATMELYLHYRNVLPSGILEIRYEDLVADLEGHARKLIEVTGQPWDEKVLRYYETDREVGTPSYEGVTQPIYTKSIGSWKRYEKHFEPILPIITPYLEKFGYDA